MEIRLLKKGYKNNEEFYNDFLEDKIKEKDEYFSGEVVHVDNAPDFPIYIDVYKRQRYISSYFNNVRKVRNIKMHRSLIRLCRVYE